MLGFGKGVMTTRSDRYYDHGRQQVAAVADWPRLHQDTETDELETGMTKASRPRRVVLCEWDEGCGWSDEVWTWIGSWLAAKENPYASEQARRELAGTENMLDDERRDYLRERRRRQRLPAPPCKVVPSGKPLGMCVLCEAEVLSQERGHEPVWPDGVLMHRTCWLGSGSPQARSERREAMWRLIRPHSVPADVIVLDTYEEGI